MFVKISVDSDDELPCIKISRSNVPSVEKNNETAAACTDVTKPSSGICHSDAAAESVAGGVVMVDSDSTDSDSWNEYMFKYSRSLRERCNASTVLSSADYASQSAESCDLQLGVGSGSAAALLTDDQSCCNSLTDNSPAAWKSYENSEEFSSERLSQTTASDMNSQTSSVQSDDKRKRKRPQKADNPDVMACNF